MSYYNSNGTYYVTYTTSNTSTWSNWSVGSNYYGNSTANYTPPNKKKNYELTHLLRKYDGELRRINKMKQALGR